MKPLSFFGRVLAGASALACVASPSRADTPTMLGFYSNYFQLDFSPSELGLKGLGLDGLGKGHHADNVLAPLSSPTPYFNQTIVNEVFPHVSFTRQGATPAATAAAGSDWDLYLLPKEIRLRSVWREGRVTEPFVLTFDTHRCYATLLGLFNSDGSVALPAVLHLPGYGTLALRSDRPGHGSVGYTSGKGWVKVSFPAADKDHLRVQYRWAVRETYPPVAGTEADPGYDGFRRNWLNIFQLNPNRRLLSNNTNSDVCGFCYYEYADIALDTPPLVEDLEAIDVVRQSLDLILGGTKTYGMPGYGDFPVETSDTAPSLLIAAFDCFKGRRDNAWLSAHYAQLRSIADKMLATDTDGDGLIKYVATGNSGSWNEGQPKVRPSNWWDTIGFGHEDAYSNALAYRALRAMAVMAPAGSEDSRRYSAAAAKLKAAYFPAFYNPSTGLLAGWRSSDGNIHDYAFTFVNGIAVLYGLVPDDKASPVMDALWAKMRAVGYTDFRLGLPGNLIPVARKDYAHKDPRYGGGKREDNLDGFQVYENGGATACYAYFTIAAYDKVGQHERARQILLPILAAFDAREFEGSGANHLTNDWRKWDGTAEGYEGFLTDNYYALMAVPEPRPLPRLVP
jgi:hypothetical protein